MSHSNHGSVASATSDARLLPRIEEYLNSLPDMDAAAAASSASSAPPAVVSIASVVQHLRTKYAADYNYTNRKQNKKFKKSVEKLCEKMRNDAMNAMGGGHGVATITSAAASDDDNDGDEDGVEMRDVKHADDVIILSSSVAPPVLPAAAVSSSVMDRSSSAPAAAGPNTPSAATAAASNNKRRRLESGAHAPGGTHETVPPVPAASSSAATAMSVSSVEGSDSSSDEDESAAAAAASGDIEFIEHEAKNIVNSSLRNLYSRRISTGGSAATTDSTAPSPAASPSSSNLTTVAATPNSQQKRARQSSSSAANEKIQYTQNSKKPLSAKKRANRNHPVSLPSVHFQTNSTGPDDPSIGQPASAGGGGDGSNWHPEIQYPTSSYADLGGIEQILQDIHELIEYPLSHPEIYTHLGIQPPRGILLHGPAGCGKTLLAHCIAGELGVPFLKISAPEVVSGMSGESEAKLRTLFADALRHAPCIIFIDEIDAITPKRATAQREMERRIVAQLLTCMDSLNSNAAATVPNAEKSEQEDEGDDDKKNATPASDPNKIVIVIGATNRPDAIDAALRRGWSL